jgi:hypothetical protein
VTNSVRIEFVEEGGKRYCIRNGKRLEVQTLGQDSLPPKRDRKAFKPKFVLVPLHWVSTLEQAKNIHTYRLAHRILAEAFRQSRSDGEIVLSAEMTGMAATSRHRAAKELERLKTMTNPNESFYHRFTLPEELKDRVLTSTEWCGGYRWFASTNVVKLEDRRPPGESRRIIERLRQHKRDQATSLVARILTEARRREESKR